MFVPTTARRDTIERSIAATQARLELLKTKRKGMYAPSGRYYCARDLIDEEERILETLQSVLLSVGDQS